MKYILILLISLNLFAISKEKLLGLYELKEYKKACLIGTKTLYQHKHDEDYLSLYALSCLNSGYIDRLAVPISALKSSKEARANSAYFSVILMQKKLLYHSLIDGYDLSILNLPSTEYILSKVFDLYAKVSNKKNKSSYLFVDSSDVKRTYKLYLFEENFIKKMAIEELYDNKIVHKYIYW